MSKPNTGMPRHQWQVLFDRVKDSTAARNVPGVLGLFSALKATCKYLRTNRTQADIAEDHGVSQPSISRAVSLLTPLIAEVLADMIPGKKDLPTHDIVLIDGTRSLFLQLLNKPHGQPVSLTVNPISRTHAETDVMQQALNRGGTQGSTATLYVDYPDGLCRPCGDFGAVKSMAKQLGLSDLTAIWPNGSERIL